MRTFRCVETSGTKYLVLHPLCLGSSTLEMRTLVSVETSGTKYLVLHPLCLGSWTILMVPLQCFRVRVSQMLELLC